MQKIFFKTIAKVKNKKFGKENTADGHKEKKVTEKRIEEKSKKS